MRYNWRRQQPDHRDHLFLVDPAKTLPAKVDLRDVCPPVVDQGDIGSCTANALAAALGFLQLREQLQGDSGVGADFPGAKFVPHSRLFIYYNERDLEGDTTRDGGAVLRDGIKSLKCIGSCSEETWPYKSIMVFNKPHNTAYLEAAGHRISEYLALDSANPHDLKSCLADGFPFVFGFTVYESFEGPDVARSGLMPMPGVFERPIGGHAVAAVGYDDASRTFIVRNSWGANWGQQGYFFMPYEYMTHPRLASDFWTLRR